MYKIKRFSRAINSLIKSNAGGFNGLNKAKDAIVKTLDKSEKLAESLGKSVKSGSISTKDAAKRLNKIRSASNNRVARLSKAISKNADSKKLDFVKPTGTGILGKLNNIARTGAAYGKSLAQ